jgi:hypothetical protein
VAVISIEIDFSQFGPLIDFLIGKQLLNEAGTCVETMLNEVRSIESCVIVSPPTLNFEFTLDTLIMVLTIF